VFGVFLDVTARKRAEEGHEMLASEMSHRVKNLFSIASALTAIAARSAATTTEMARDLTQRLTALGRAHDLVRPVPGQMDAKAALLGDLLTVLLAPYDEDRAVGQRVHVTVPAVRVGSAAMTTLALIVHELATNSIKYGALSAASGRLDVSCPAIERDMVLIWTERGGPPVEAPVEPTGFGSRLVTQSMSSQLGGTIAFDWQPDGLIATLRMSKARLAT
jgi:two-component sensor histidine kinase